MSHSRKFWGTATAMLVALCCAVVSSGCAVFRYVDYKVPSIRVERPHNAPLPTREDPAVQQALDKWAGMTDDAARAFPTPYHVYVDTPAPGTFEGEYVVGLAFSGGGTRGTVFEAMCVNAIRELGHIVVETPDGARRIAVLDEVDYVSGASTGAIPAAAFALNRTETCPETVRFAHWPDCFNANLTGRVMRHELMRPDRILRDVVLGPNVGPAVTGAMAAAFFDGNAHCPASGLTFGDLPQTPVLLVGATVVNDPAVPFIHTRLPYRYCIDTYPHTTWGIGVQTFESFHADPMTYALGQAAYNSSSFPGYMRSGLMAVRADQAWVFEGLEGAARERLERARHQPGYGGVYELKDGGLVDNRAIAPIDRIFDAVASRGGWESRPLLIALDAGYLDIRQPEKGANLLGKGWSSEVYAVMRASWQTGQYAYERLFDKNVADGVYAHARFRLTAWTRYLTGTVPSEQSEPGLSPFSRPSEGHSEPGPSPFPPSPEADYLRKLCRQAPAIGTPSRLLEALRGIGTTLTDLSERQMDALRVAAEFAVWHEKDALIAWASAIYDGAPARFAPSG